MQLIHTRQFQGTIDRIQEIREFVGDAVVALGGDDDCVFAAELAVDEAATNAFVHAYGGKVGLVEIELRRDGSSLIVVVRNWGPRFDPDAVPYPDPNTPLLDRRPGGMGLYLIRQLMSRVSFGFDPVKGNTIVMQRPLAISPLR